MPNKLLKKFASFSFGTWIGLIIGVIGTPIITRLFSPEDFGRASMFNMAINILMIFVVFGTDQTYVRFFYEEEKEKRKYLLRNALRLPVFIFILLIPVLYIFREKISSLLFNESYIGLISLLIAGILIYAINRFSVLVIRMEQRGKIFSILQICSKVLELLGIIILVKIFGNGFKNIIYARFITVTLVAIIAIWYGRDNWKFFKRGIKTKHKSVDILKYSSPLVLTTLITWLFQSFDKFAIKNWSSLEDLGIYAAAFRIIAILNIIQTTFTTFWSPVVYETYEKDPKNTRLFEDVSRILSITMMCIATGTIMFKDVIALLLGEKFREASMIMPFLVFMPVMYTISETTVIGIKLKKKVKWNILIAGISCFVNIVGNLFLVPVYGGKGAAISTGVSYIVFFSLRTYFSLKYYKVNYHLKELSITIFMVLAYALYNTFYNNLGINIFLGVTIIIFIIILNFKFLKKMIFELKDNV